jgi:hypothetical protein
MKTKMKLTAVFEEAEERGVTWLSLKSCQELIHKVIRSKSLRQIYWKPLNWFCKPNATFLKRKWETEDSLKNSWNLRNEDQQFCSILRKL